jgi:hypothetical protein
MDTIRIEPIGVVRNGVTEAVDEGWGEVAAEIVLAARDARRAGCEAAPGGRGVRHGCPCSPILRCNGF